MRFFSKKVSSNQREGMYVTIFRHIAAREDRYNCVIVLLARGANVSLVNKNNETPLECLPEDGESYNVIALNLKLQAVAGTDLRNYRTLLSK